MSRKLLIAVSVTSLMLLIASATMAQSNDPGDAIATADPTPAEAIPIIEEALDDHGAVVAVSSEVIQLPAGWFYVRMVAGGFLLEHEDGSQARIMRCVQTTSYRVAWNITYESNDLNCVSTNIMRVEQVPPENDEVSLRVSVPDECMDNSGERPTVSSTCTQPIRAVAITAYWPPNVVEALLQELNTETRHGTCSR